MCCGIIFKGLNGEVLVDTKLLRPCICKSASNSANTSSGELTPPHEAHEALTPAMPELQDKMEEEEDEDEDDLSMTHVSQDDSQDSVDIAMDTSAAMTPASTVPSTPTSTMPSTPTSPTRAAIEAVLDLSLPGPRKMPLPSMDAARCIQLEV